MATPAQGRGDILGVSLLQVPRREEKAIVADFFRMYCLWLMKALSGQTVHVGSASKLFPIRKPPGSCFSASWTLFFGCFGYFAYRNKSVARQSGLTEAKSQSKFCNSAVKKQFPMGIWKKKENSNCEILAKKNPTYLVLLVEYRSLKFAIPFRSNIRHSHAYK